MKTKFIGLFLVLFTVAAYAQQEAQYTQYMYNTSVINPAYTGSREALTIFGLHRTQWAGLEGAPTTNNISISSPVGRNVGLGLTVVNDKIGPADENNFAVDFAYGFNISENYKLSFGLKASLSSISDVLYINTAEAPLSFAFTAFFRMYSLRSKCGLSLLARSISPRSTNHGMSGSWIASDGSASSLICGL